MASTVLNETPGSQDISNDMEKLTITIKHLKQFKKSIAGRFFLMLGGADFFYTYQGQHPRGRPEELNRLQIFLDKLNNQTKEKSVIFAFDKNYELHSILREIKNLNEIISKNNEDPLQGPLIMGSYSKSGKIIPFKPQNSFPLWFGNSHTTIYFFDFNLESIYKNDYHNRSTLYNLLAGNTTIQNIVEKCVPDQGSLFSELQRFLNEKTFREYYLYNCAWIGAKREVMKNENETMAVMINIVENKYYEGMCELIHIFRNLPNSYILTSHKMNAFNHPLKEEITNTNKYKDTIYKVPFNANTSFKKMKLTFKGGVSKETRKQKVKTYQIHDNGGRPFSVEINGKKVKVIQHKGDYEFNEKVNLKWIPEPPKEVLSFNADKIFIGKKSPGGGYDGLKPSEAEGNSILLKVGKKYIYIGSEIFEFDPVQGDEIQEYYSDIGNSDVPYPYAVGKTHVYIMLERTAIDKSYFGRMKDIYDQYWFDMTVKDCGSGVFVKEPPFCKNIHKHSEETKKKLKNLKRKTRKLKKKVLVKRDM